MAKSGARGVTRLVKTFGYSMQGLRAAWVNEEAFRLEMYIALVLVPLAFWVGENAFEQALLIGSCGVVLMIELCNSAIEAIVDRIGSEYHELSGRAKDLGSAAVFISLVTTVVIWALLAIERFD